MNVKDKDSSAKYSYREDILCHNDRAFVKEEAKTDMKERERERLGDLETWRFGDLVYSFLIMTVAGNPHRTRYNEIPVVQY